MAEIAKELSEIWALLQLRRRQLQDEIYQHHIKSSNLSIELDHLEKLIEKLGPISKVEEAYNYLQNLRKGE